MSDDVRITLFIFGMVGVTVSFFGMTALCFHLISKYVKDDDQDDTNNL